MRTTFSPLPATPIKMTEVDRRFLAELPESADWFKLNGLSQYRIKRLLKAGVLQSRVVDPSLTASVSIYAETHYRRVQPAELREAH